MKTTENPALLKFTGLSASLMLVTTAAQASSDYGPAIWRPTCNANYYTSGSGHKFHVIHDMEGYYAATISLFTSCGYTSASVHYAANGKQDASSDYPAGEITQMVTEANYAWHVRCWNQYCTGTEHEGFASNPAWYTEAMYQASAALTAHECTKFGYPKDRNHVVGHNEWQNAAWRSYAGPAFGIDTTCNSHTDPGPYWNWSHFMALVQGGTSYVPGDFLGDGKTDYALWTPSTGNWNIRDSATGSIYTFNWGQNGDIPLIGNFTTPTGAEAVIFRPSNGTWYWRSGATGNLIGSYQWGQAGDIPLIGAWSGRMRDAAVFRPSNGTWYVRFGDTGQTASFAFGANGDVPLIGDFFGHGMIDEVVFHPATGMWYWRNGGDGSTIGQYQWGQTNDIPMIGAWSGKMRDAALFRPSNGTWYIRFGDTGNTVTIQFGQNGDVPMVGNIFGHGIIDQIVYRPSNGTWYVRDGINGNQYSFAFGSSLDQAVHE